MKIADRIITSSQNDSLDKTSIINMKERNIDLSDTTHHNSWSYFAITNILQTFPSCLAWNCYKRDILR